MSSFHGRVQELSKAGVKPEDIVNQLQELYHRHPKLRAELRPVIAHEVSSVLSRMRHEAEEAAFAHGDPVIAGPRSTRITGRINAKEAAAQWRNPTILTWLATRVAMPDGTHVTWGEMTVEQHRDRMDSLQRTIDGYNETIRRHVIAADAIRAWNVTCLNDLDVGIAREVYELDRSPSSV